MIPLSPGTPGRLPIIIALALQLAILRLSLTRFPALSVFCTVADAPLLLVFNALHYGYVALLLLGVASLLRPGARRPYLLLLAVPALALPMQAWLVQEGHRRCDGP